MELKHKIRITGAVTLETGMHIGGSEVDLDIGGRDNAVAIDNKSKKAYIPGSSLKGKLRDLIARAKGYDDLNLDLGSVYVLFGEGANSKSGRAFGKLIVRDSFAIDEDVKLEEKAENTIDRAFGDANPRHVERVVKGNRFKLDLILDIYEKYDVKVQAQYVKARQEDRGRKYKKYLNKFKQNNRGDHILQTHFQNKAISENDLLETLRLGFRLLEHDYLGGSGTRGYGKVSLDFDTPVRLTFNQDGTITESNITNFDFNKKKNDENS